MAQAELFDRLERMGNGELQGENAWMGSGEVREMFNISAGDIAEPEV